MMVNEEDINEDLEEEIEEEVQDISTAEPVTDEDLAEGFAFPMAPIVRVMKEELDEDKMVRRRVKEGMNKWLEKLCRKIARRMNESEYTMVELDDFKTAKEPYEMIESIEAERNRIVANLEKIKQDCNVLIMDVDRKFMEP